MTTSMINDRTIWGVVNQRRNLLEPAMKRCDADEGDGEVVAARSAMRITPELTLLVVHYPEKFGQCPKCTNIA
jgi:hypothetical protein